MSSWEENYDWIQDIYRAINPGLPEITLRQYKVSVSWLLIMTPEHLKKKPGLVENVLSPGSKH